MGERKAGRQGDRWESGTGMEEWLALGVFIVMRIELMTMNPLVQYSNRESLSTEIWVLMIYLASLLPHWPTKGPLYLQQGKLTSSSPPRTPTHAILLGAGSEISE